jgi:hypothetical protein
LENQIEELKTETEDSIEKLEEDVAQRGVGLFFNEEKKTLHMVYGDDSISEDGIKVATDLTGYATEKYVDNRLDIGTKTVKRYVDDKIDTVDVSK